MIAIKYSIIITIYTGYSDSGALSTILRIYIIQLVIAASGVLLFKISVCTAPYLRHCEPQLANKIISYYNLITF